MAIVLRGLANPWGGVEAWALGGEWWMDGP